MLISHTSFTCVCIHAPPTRTRTYSDNSETRTNANTLTRTLYKQKPGLHSIHTQISIIQGGVVNPGRSRPSFRVSIPWHLSHSLHLGCPWTDWFFHFSSFCFTLIAFL